MCGGIAKEGREGCGVERQARSGCEKIGVQRGCIRQRVLARALRLVAGQNAAGQVEAAERLGGDEGVEFGREGFAHLQRLLFAGGFEDGEIALVGHAELLAQRVIELLLGGGDGGEVEQVGIPHAAAVQQQSDDRGEENAGQRGAGRKFVAE